MSLSHKVTGASYSWFKTPDNRPATGRQVASAVAVVVTAAVATVALVALATGSHGLSALGVPALSTHTFICLAVGSGLAAPVAVVAIGLRRSQPAIPKSALPGVAPRKGPEPKGPSSPLTNANTQSNPSTPASLSVTARSLKDKKTVETLSAGQIIDLIKGHNTLDLIDLCAEAIVMIKDHPEAVTVAVGSKLTLGTLLNSHYPLLTEAVSYQKPLQAVSIDDLKKIASRYTTYSNKWTAMVPLIEVNHLVSLLTVSSSPPQYLDKIPLIKQEALIRFLLNSSKELSSNERALLFSLFSALPPESFWKCGAREQDSEAYKQVASRKPFPKELSSDTLISIIQFFERPSVTLSIAQKKEMSQALLSAVAKDPSILCRLTEFTGNFLIKNQLLPMSAFLGALTGETYGGLLEKEWLIKGWVALFMEPTTEAAAIAFLVKVRENSHARSFLQGVGRALALQASAISPKTCKALEQAGLLAAGWAGPFVEKLTVIQIKDLTIGPCRPGAHVMWLTNLGDNNVRVLPIVKKAFFNGEAQRQLDKLENGSTLNLVKGLRGNFIACSLPDSLSDILFPEEVIASFEGKKIQSISVNKSKKMFVVELYDPLTKTTETQEVGWSEVLLAYA